MRWWKVLWVLILFWAPASAQGYLGFSLRWEGALSFKAFVEQPLLSLGPFRLSLGAAYRFPGNYLWGYTLWEYSPGDEVWSLELGTDQKQLFLGLNWVRRF